MEQLTAKEWVKEQFRHTPSFAVSTALLVLFLLISTFVDLTAGSPPPTTLNVEVGLAAEHSQPPLVPTRIPLDPISPSTGKSQETNLLVDFGKGIGEGGIGKGVGVNKGDGFRNNPEENTVDLRGPQGPDFANFIEDPIRTPSDKARIIRTRNKDDSPLEGFTQRQWISGPPGHPRGPGGPPGGPPPIGNVTAVLDGLAWLKRVQEPDGHWDPTAAKCGAGSNVPNGVTGLALLAFLGFGCTDTTPEFGPTVRKAIDYLLAHQSSDGSFGERMYTQAICTMALTESYGMMPRETRLKEAAQRGLNFIIARQPATGAIGGFGYDGPGSDMSVTGFQFQAFKAAEAARLDIPRDALERADKFLELSLNNDGSCSYQVGNKSQTGSLSMTAANLTARLFRAHSAGAPDCARQAQWLANNNFQQAANTQNYYTIYYLSLAAFNMGGEYWDKWNGKNTGDPSFYTSLQKTQIQTGDDRGSWPGGDYGGAGSRVYSTALACLSLEVTYRYKPVSQTTPEPAGAKNM